MTKSASALVDCAGPYKMRQFFQRKAATGVFGSLDECLRNFVIGMRSEVGLLPGQFFGVSFGSLGAALLKPRFTTSQFRMDPLNLGSDVGDTVTVESQIDDTEIDAPVVGIEFFSLGNVACRSEVPLATDEARIGIE